MTSAQVFCLVIFLSIWFCWSDRAIVHAAPRVALDPSPSEGRPTNSGGNIVKVGVDLVLVPVSVTDRRDHLVIGLPKDAFHIFDQGSQEVIRNLSNQDAPISLGIIFDASSSMRGKIERSREAVVQFLRRANPDDEFFLIGFNDSPRPLVGFTSSVEQIQSEIFELKPDGTTALLDALYLGLEEMKKARNERKVLLIVSDGGDNHSRYTTKEVWSVVREAGVQIYAMSIFDEAPRTNAERRGPDLLSATTGITGGRTVAIHNLKKIGDAASELATELRNQYLITYRPSNLAHDGQWHKITVRLNSPQNSPRLRVHAKAGYYTPAQ